VFLSFGAIELIHYRLMQKNRYNNTVNSGPEVDCVRYILIYVETGNVKQQANRQLTHLKSTISVECQLDSIFFGF